MRRRRWALAGGVAAAAAAAALGALVAGGALDRAPSAPMSTEELCRELVAVDVGRALVGQDELAQVRAISLLADVGERAPEDVRPAVVAIARLAAEEPLVGEVAEGLDDPAARAQAFQATYRLRFSPRYGEAAARVERFAVERCGTTPSGSFDLDVPWELDERILVDLDLDGFEPPAAELDAVIGQPFELPPFVPPTVVLVPDRPERYQLQPYEIPDAQLDVGDR